LFLTLRSNCCRPRTVTISECSGGYFRVGGREEGPSANWVLLGELRKVLLIGVATEYKVDDYVANATIQHVVI